MAMERRRPSFSYDWSSDEESFVVASDAGNQKEAEISSSVLNNPEQIIPTRHVMAGAFEDGSLPCSNKITPGETLSVPGIQKGAPIRYDYKHCPQFLRNHIRLFLVIFLTFIFGLLVGTFFLGTGLSNSRSKTHNDESGRSSKISVGVFYYPWHSGQ